MIVVECNEIRNLERAAMRSGVSMTSLMEKAGAAVAELAATISARKGMKNIAVLCGSGNNGGDGFVVARFLSMMCDVTVITSSGIPESELARMNYNMLPDNVKVLDFPAQYDECINSLGEAQIIIDGIYGIGFRDFLDPASAELIQTANRRRDAVRIAIDVPSGAVCDTGEVPSGCFHADYTVTFTALKPVHVLYPSMDYCGEVSVSKVGIPDEMLAQCTYAMKTTDEFISVHSLPELKRSAHKGTNGTLLSICGSYGMAGAAIMAGRASLRSGVGILRCALPRSIYPIAAGKMIEAVFIPLEETEDGRISDNETERLQREIMEKSSAVLIGCGLGTGEETSRLVSKLIVSSTKPIVLDADGINAISQNIDVLRRSNVPVILTPHPGEMARLTGVSTSGVQSARYRIARNFAEEYGVTVVLKGANTIIALPDGNVYVNMTGNSGMAKGGSGDILAGMLASFLAQGMNYDEAAISAVYYHGLAGDECLKEFSARAMLPGDILDRLVRVLR